MANGIFYRREPRELSVLNLSSLGVSRHPTHTRLPHDSYSSRHGLCSSALSNVTCLLLEPISSHPAASQQLDSPNPKAWLPFPTRTRKTVTTISSTICISPQLRCAHLEISYAAAGWSGITTRAISSLAAPYSTSGIRGNFSISFSTLAPICVVVRPSSHPCVQLLHSHRSLTPFPSTLLASVYS